MSQLEMLVHTAAIAVHIMSWNSFNEDYGCKFVPTKLYYETIKILDELPERTRYAVIISGAMGVQSIQRKMWEREIHPCAFIKSKYAYPKGPYFMGGIFK